MRESGDSRSKKKLQTCKPDSVLPTVALAKVGPNIALARWVLQLKLRWVRLSFICPNSYEPGSICLPIGIERAALRRRLMWHFSMQGLPLLYIAV